ncbi:hypothetical protein [Blastomonas sp.]|uniref:hypothetical protein n=1 Tax=Blastomonas sp. TaxID=1909299 RepID=UPI003594152B
MLLIGCAALALGACGSRQKLTAVEGTAPVPRAYGAEKPQSVDELLKPSAQARPERNVELQRRSQAREDDPFDLPPD